MNASRALPITSVALFLLLLQGCPAGFQGGIFEQPVCAVIASVSLTFVK